MAGTVRAKLDCRSTAGGASNAIITGRNLQAMFTTIWNLLDSHPNLTRIASNYGNASSATNIAPTTNSRGIGYWDESVNFGYDAFGVWRFNSALWPWYLFLELLPAQSNTISNSGQILGATSSALYYIGISAAWGVTAGGAAGNPWAGGTANAGADARATTRWTDPGGGVYVLGRSNSLYGTHATNKNNSLNLVRLGSQNATLDWNVWVDDDSFLVSYDLGGGNAWATSGVVRYTPKSGLTVSRPYAMVTAGNADTSPPATATVIGSLAGNASADGGIIVPDGITGPVRPFLIDRFANYQASTSYQPSNVSGTPLYDEFPVKAIVSAPLESTALVGEVGYLDPRIIREVYNVPTVNTKPDLSRVFLANTTTTAALKNSLPWDSSTAPRTFANGRTGVSASISI